MKKPIMITYNGKEYKVGEQITCDKCTKVIYDSRHDKKSNPFYIAYTKTCETNLNTYTVNSNIYNISNISVSNVTIEPTEVHCELCSSLCAMSIFNDFIKEADKNNRNVFHNEIRVEAAVYESEIDYDLTPKDIPNDTYKELQRKAV